jgi:3-hydroxyisobutyrate dehydrogenase
MLAFIGTGLLGSSFVRGFLKRGEPVRVWNRTAAKARALEGEGAIVVEDLVEAVRGAVRVHLSLADDAAVDEVLERLLPALGAEAVVIDHSTTLPTETAERARHCAARGVRFLHAPVFMAPQNALQGSGVMLVSGDWALVEGLVPELKKMTGQLGYLGPAPERAAMFKLLGTMFLMIQITGAAEVLRFAKSLGVSKEEAAQVFGFFSPAVVTTRVSSMLQGDFSAPTLKLSTARKDVALMEEEAALHQAVLPLLPAMARELDRWMESGHGHEDWLVIAKDAV